jgi:hypothetical protein
MRELRLKYIISLVSDIGPKAKADEAVLAKLQDKLQQELGDTNKQLGLMERALLRVGGVARSSMGEQVAYLSRLALSYERVRIKAEAYANTVVKIGRVGTGVAAGGAAGAYALDRVTRAPMEYSLRLAHIANTAYADRDVAGRRQGRNLLDSAINASVRTGGGTRDDAAATLDSLIASGVVPPEVAMRLLPTLMRASTASNAPAAELGNIALRGMQSFGLSLDQVPEALNMAMAAGQAGGFELRDMSRWLPQAMAAGKLSGLTGMEGLRRLLASMQAQVVVAGSRDEAGNNLINLLAKVSSRDTALDFEKQGIDLPGRLARDRARGVNSLDSFVGLVDEVVGKDPRFAALSKQLAAEKDTGRETEATEAMRAIFQGAGIGNVVQDRQALMALVAEVNNRKYIQDVMAKTRTNTGAIGTSFDVVSEELAFKRQQALNEAAIGAQTALDKVSPALGAVAETATAAAQAMPNLTAVVMGATGALVAFTAALGAAGLVGMLTGRAGNAGGLVTTAGKAAGALGAGAAALARPNLWWLRGAGLVAAPVIGAGLTTFDTATDDTLSGMDKARGYAKAGAGLTVGIGGALGGAALGSLLLPGVGTVVGGLLGGLGGSFGGEKLLEWLWQRDPSHSVTGPDGQPLLANGGRVELGQGKIDVSVRVEDGRVSAGTAMSSSPTLLLQAGSTDPGSLGVAP